MREPDAVFAHPRLAVLYDFFDNDRSDLDAYVAIVEEAAARSVVDIGCGTGSLAVRLAALGLEVVGVDPAGASLDVARGKSDAGRVRWVDGDATSLTSLDHAVDLAVMTGNVAQVFVTDEDWNLTLTAVHAALRRDGWFVFETRRPDARAWEDWDVAPTDVELPGGVSGVVCRTVTEVALPLVTFESTLTIADEPIRSVSTLRFREQAEVEDDLVRHGFEVVDVRAAPDRPGREFVFIARRSDE